MPLDWKQFRRTDGTIRRGAKEAIRGNFLQLAAAEAGAAVDGGWTQRVSGLDAAETYRLTCRVRSTWPLSVDHAIAVGVDPTGQIDDPEAETIEWTLLPSRHGEWVEFRSEPVRPRRDALGVWLRGRAKSEDARFPFRADFDDVSVRRVATGVPRIEKP